MEKSTLTHLSAAWMCFPHTMAFYHCLFANLFPVSFHYFLYLWPFKAARARVCSVTVELSDYHPKFRETQDRGVPFGLCFVNVLLFVT